MNKFMQAMTQKDTQTWNGAVSNSSSGCTLLDYFSKSGTYRGRDLNTVWADMSALFATDALTALKMVFYNRMITRKPNDVETVQRGQGQRDEFVKALAYLELSLPGVLEKNLHLVPVVGRWSDLWYDSASTGFYFYTNTELVYPLVQKGMQDDRMRGLIAKYLPKIRSKSNVKNDRHRRLNAWARGLCKYLGLTELQYRLFKSSPENTAHLWQRQMCWNKWDGINFDTIPGKALTQFVKLVDKHNLTDKYVSWLSGKPVAKYTGYVYELYKEYRASSPTTNRAKRMTYNKQFQGLLEKGRQDLPAELLNSNVLCALDTSGSMSWSSFGGVTPLDVCVGLGVYFSALNTGEFKDTVVMFSDRSTTLKLKGEFCDRVDQIHNSGWAMGSTNFQSVIDLIVNVRMNNPSIPIEDYPKVLLVVSDMQFNPAGSVDTNYEVLMKKLEKVGLPKMSVIWWQVTDRTKDVPSTMFDEGTTLISGFDGSIISSILGCQEVVDEKTGEKRKPTPDEVMVAALDQEVLNKLEV